MKDLPNTQLREYPEYREALAEYERIKQEAQELFLQLDAASRRLNGSSERAARESDAAVAFTAGDRRRAAEVMQRSPYSEFDELAALHAAAALARAAAKNRLDKTAASIKKRVSEAYRGEYEKRIGAVRKQLEKVADLVEYADEITDALQEGRTHSPRELPLPNLTPLRRNFSKPWNTGRTRSPLEVVLKTIDQSYTSLAPAAAPKPKKKDAPKRGNEAGAPKSRILENAKAREKAFRELGKRKGAPVEVPLS